MKKLTFYKLQASGNDFILLDKRHKSQVASHKYKKLARRLCQRKFGIGADGLLVIEPSKRAFFKMRIFNPDGSEAEMCGNGARCVALWASNKKSQVTSHKSQVKRVRFDTIAGIIEAEVKHKTSEVRIKMSDPFGIKLDMPLKVLGRGLKVNFVNTGVPHTVIFVEGLEKIDVETIGRAIRFHKQFQPAGTNVNFAELIDKNTVRIRTYERGVEVETLACGTGAVASAIIASLKSQAASHKTKDAVRVKTRGGEELKVYFSIDGKKISYVWLEGKAELIYKGELPL